MLNQSMSATCVLKMPLNPNQPTNQPLAYCLQVWCRNCREIRRKSSAEKEQRRMACRQT